MDWVANVIPRVKGELIMDGWMDGSVHAADGAALKLRSDPHLSRLKIAFALM